MNTAVWNFTLRFKALHKIPGKEVLIGQLFEDSCKMVKREAGRNRQIAMQKSDIPKSRIHTARTKANVKSFEYENFIPKSHIQQSPHSFESFPSLSH